MPQRWSLTPSMWAPHTSREHAELLSTSPSTLMLSQDNAEAEAKMWDCFAEVFEQEVSLAAA